ncbi:MAG: hypothetical protein DSM106950_34270 [Stigonema ocellatum SAG 48.90 = DSM 106950]|nr:hypothetical protein [Stigonema ocellatum SAG 48.90 = DSM 106950]
MGSGGKRGSGGVSSIQIFHCQCIFYLQKLTKIKLLTDKVAVTWKLVHYGMLKDFCEP